MKKVFVTVALALTAMLCYAGENGDVKFLDNTGKSIKAFDGIGVVDEKVGTDSIKLSCVAFYDIERLYISNERKVFVRVVDERGKVVVESHDTIDINLPSGNYKVYSSSDNLIALYR